MAAQLKRWQRPRDPRQEMAAAQLQRPPDPGEEREKEKRQRAHTRHV